MENKPRVEVKRPPMKVKGMWVVISLLGGITAIEFVRLLLAGGLVAKAMEVAKKFGIDIMPSK